MAKITLVRDDEVVGQQMTVADAFREIMRCAQSGSHPWKVDKIYLGKRPNKQGVQGKMMHSMVVGWKGLSNRITCKGTHQDLGVLLSLLDADPSQCVAEPFDNRLIEHSVLVNLMGPQYCTHTFTYWREVCLNELVEIYDSSAEYLLLCWIGQDKHVAFDISKVNTPEVFAAFKELLIRSLGEKRLAQGKAKKLR